MFLDTVSQSGFVPLGLPFEPGWGPFGVGQSISRSSRSGGLAGISRGSTQTQMGSKA